MWQVSGIDVTDNYYLSLSVYKIHEVYLSSPHTVRWRPLSECYYSPTHYGFHLIGHRAAGQAHSHQVFGQQNNHKTEKTQTLYLEIIQLVNERTLH